MKVGTLFAWTLITATLALILVVNAAPACANVSPDVTPQLAACVTEDGAGVALCWWDASRQGNGRGTSVVSGDCAQDIARIAWCVKVYRMGRTG